MYEWTKKKLLIETTLYATKTHNRKNLHELFPRSAYYVEIASKVKTCTLFLFESTLESTEFLTLFIL